MLHDEDGHKKFKYLVSRFKYDQEIYYFPDVDLNYMYFGKCEVWDDSYAIKTGEDVQMAVWEKALKDANDAKPSWD